LKRKWNPEIIEHLRQDESDEIFEAVLEEVAGVIYSELCQLHENRLSDSLTFESNSYQRTGTDG